MKILVINGPNINMLGKRSVEHYGSLTLDEINTLISQDKAFEFTFIQSNHEGVIVDVIQQAASYDGLIINPASLTHTSIAIRDALEILTIIKVEVHLSNLSNRENFRQINLISDVCDATFSGEHVKSYLNAVNYLKMRLSVV